MSENKVIIGGSVIPSIPDAPIDIRTRVNTIDDIYNIELPYIGMIIYVIDEDKYYKVKTLKAKTAGSITINDSLVDTFEEFLIPNFTGALSLNRKADTRIGEYSSSLGYECAASGNCTHAEGYNTVANGYASHAEGYSTESRGMYSHSEGYGTVASGFYSHAEGSQTQANGSSSHAEGVKTIAKGEYSHAEGSNTIANGTYSHAEGGQTIAAASYQHVQGKYNIEDAEGKYAHIVGNGEYNEPRSNAHTLDWNGNAWFQGDVFVKGTNQDDAQKLATENYVETHIYNLTVDVTQAIENIGSIPGPPGENGKDFTYDMFTPEQLEALRGPAGQDGAAGQDADISKLLTKIDPIAEGSFSLNRKIDSSIGLYSSTLGQDCTSSASYSHAEGYKTAASGKASHAEGEETKTYSAWSHAEGYSTSASGIASHAEGGHTKTNKEYSHAEGYYSKAYGVYSHAENYNTEASGSCSHAEGANACASGARSHAEGYYTTAAGENQHVQGKYNVVDNNNQYVHIVGNGSTSQPSNAHTLDWDGNAWFQGDVFIKGTNQDDAQKIATEDMVIALQQEIAELRVLIEELKNK